VRKWISLVTSAKEKVAEYVNNPVGLKFGCGMVDPEVFRHVKYDSELNTGLL
jgi:hypothetical protein